VNGLPDGAMAVGFKDEDFKKPLVGIASTWSMVTPCNMHIDKLARESEKGANAAGGKAIIFNTITVSDGISMGTEGMKYSLVSREVIADSIETVVGCEGMDGGGHRRLRQEHARLRDGHGAAEPARPSSSMAARSCPAASPANAKRHRLRSSRPSARTRKKIDDAELQAVEAMRHSRARLLRRHVHRQHHGQRHRSARHEPAQQLRAAAISPAKMDDCRARARRAA
jgi:hypothetical protein